MMTKERTLIYTAYCKNCDKDISSSSDQDQALMPAIQHCTKNNHEIVFGMTIKRIGDPEDEKNMSEHVAYCKNCHKDIAKSINTDAVLRSAMEHCEKTRHELAYGIIVKID